MNDKSLIRRLWKSRRAATIISLIAASMALIPLPSVYAQCECERKIKIVPDPTNPTEEQFIAMNGLTARENAEARIQILEADNKLVVSLEQVPDVVERWSIKWVPLGSVTAIDDPLLTDKTQKCDLRNGKPSQNSPANGPGAPAMTFPDAGNSGCSTCQQGASAAPTTVSAPPPYEQLLDTGAGYDPATAEPLGRVRFNYDFSADQQLPSGFTPDQFSWDGYTLSTVTRDPGNNQWITAIRAPGPGMPGTYITLTRTTDSSNRVTQVVVTTSSTEVNTSPSWFPTRTTTYNVTYVSGTAKVTITDNENGEVHTASISGVVAGSSATWETTDFNGEHKEVNSFVSGGQKTTVIDVTTSNTDGASTTQTTKVSDAASGKILSETMVADGTSLTTLYSYWSGTGTPKDGKLKSITYPTGDWIAYVNYDSQGRATEILKPWLDTPATPAAGIASPSECLSETVAYTYDIEASTLPFDVAYGHEWAVPVHSRVERTTQKGNLVIAQSIRATTVVKKVAFGAHFPVRAAQIPYDAEYVIVRSRFNVDPATGHRQGTWEITGLSEHFSETEGNHFEGTISSNGRFTYREYLPLSQGVFPSVSGSSTLSNAVAYYRESYRDVNMDSDRPQILADGPPEKLEVWLDESGRELARVTKVGTTIIDLVETTYAADGSSEQKRSGTSSTPGFTVWKKSAPINTTIALNPPSTTMTAVSAVTETDIEGNTTKIYRDNQMDEVVRTEHLTAGAAASTVLTDTTYFNPATHTYTQTTTAGNPVTLKRVSTRQVDNQGRTLAVTNTDGSTASYGYSSNGLETTETRTGGITLVTRKYLDGRLKSVTGTGTLSEYHNYEVVDLGNGAGGILDTVRIGSDNSLRMSTSVTDPLGRVVRQTRPAPPQMDGLAGGSITLTMTYDSAGRPLSRSQTGQPTRLYSYSRTTGTGAEVTTEALDLSENVNVSTGNGTIDVDGHDIVTVTSAYYELTPDKFQVRKQSVLKAGPNGESKDTYTKQLLNPHNVEVTQVITPDGAKTMRTRTITPGNSSTQGLSQDVELVQPPGTTSWTTIRTADYRDELLRGESAYPATVATNYAYDGLRRKSTVSVTPTGSGRYQAWTYDVASTVTKDFNLTYVEGETNANGGKLTTYAYETTATASYGKVKSMTTEAGVVYYEYDNLGRVVFRWGTAKAPVAYTYASETGELTSMKTYQNGLAAWSSATKPTIWTTAASSLTSWSYDVPSGALLGKTDAAGNTISYLYDRAGRIGKKTSARGIVTEYGYDGAGRPAGRVYSDGTPSVVMQYSKGGDLTSLQDAAGSHTFVTAASGFDDVTETVSSTTGDWKGLTFAISRTIDTTSRRQTEVVVNEGASELYRTKRTQLLGGAMESVQGLGIKTTYVRNNFGQVTSTGTAEVAGSGYPAFGANDVLDTSLALTYDLGRVETIRYAATGATAVKQGWTYGFNAAWQRTTTTPSTTGRTGWLYTYNTDGSVATAVRRNGTTAVSRQNWVYQYDAIGDRTAIIRGTTAGATDAPQRTHSYTAPTSTPKDGTQYGTITHPSLSEVSGLVTPSTTVTAKLNNLSPTSASAALTLAETGSYYREFDLSALGATPRWIIMNTSVGSGASLAKNDGWYFYRGTSESLTYDADGNLTSDAHWTYTWDAENHLTVMEEKVIAGPLDGTPPPARLRLAFNYDAYSRRTSKKVYVRNGSTWDLQTQIIFLYDKWNLVAELDALKGNRVLRRYVWGPDLSGTMGGAGGVGGLLFVENATDSWTSGSTTIPGVRYAVQNDGNGNVMGLVALDGPKERTLAGRFDYEAFGNRVTNTLAEGQSACPIGFSSKYEDAETGLLYYGFRYYQPETGRWLLRDPADEDGGLNLYGMVGNDLVNQIDYLGLNEYGTPQNPVSPYDIAVGTTKTITNEKGMHVTDCCFWVGADGKPGSGIGNREGWLRWHLGYWGDHGIGTPTVRQAFATDLVDGLGLTSSLIYGGNVQYVIKLRRNSETNYTWILDWTAVDLDKAWLKSTVGAKKCEKFTPAKTTSTKEVNGDVFGGGSNSPQEPKTPKPSTSPFP